MFNYWSDEMEWDKHCHSWINLSGAIIFILSDIIRIIAFPRDNNAFQT